MPTYDYVCSHCNHAWEFEQRIIESAIDTCPKCGEKTAKRQISSGAGFILKGGGWYADLYSSSKKGAAEGAPSTTPASTTPSKGDSASTGSPSSATPAAPAAAPAKSGSGSSESSGKSGS